MIVMQKFGRLPDIDAGGANEDIWDGEGAYSWPAAEATMKISSSSADDAAEGTGARTVLVYGQGDDGIEFSEVVSMNGQTGVTITTDMRRVYRARVVTVGSGGVNAGDIWIGTGTITDGVPANKYAGILTGLGQTLMAIYTMPYSLATGETVGGGTLTRWYATVGAGQAAYATVALQTRASGEGWRTRRAAGIGEGGGLDETLTGGIAIPALTDVRLRAISNGVNNSEICAGFDIVMNTWDS